MRPEDLELVQAEYRAGKAAFARGDYRKSVQCLERARAAVDSQSQLGGEIQTWLVTAYEAAGQQSEAIALCRIISQHPDLTTRQQGKQLLYILEAPKLKTRPEWLTQIPDLANLADSDPLDRRAGAAVSPPKPLEKPGLVLEPADLSQVNTRDNRFIWVSLGLIIVILGSLLWLA